MLKIPSKASINLSIILAVIFFVGCVVGAFFLPQFTNILIDTKDNIGNRDNITVAGRIFVHILAYMLVADILLADILLFNLLNRVKKGLVFTSDSVALIRGVSWCCLFLCVIFCGLGVYFQLAFIVAFAAMFLGLCIRVVKNVIEQATEIKQENDLTV